MCVPVYAVELSFTVSPKSCCTPYFCLSVFAMSGPVYLCLSIDLSLPVSVYVCLCLFCPSVCLSFLCRLNFLIVMDGNRLEKQTIDRKLVPGTEDENVLVKHPRSGLPPTVLYNLL